jgi:transposase
MEKGNWKKKTSRERDKTMTKIQRTFTREFKLEAVKVAQSSGKPFTQVARDLGIADTTLHRWRQQFSEQGEQAFPGRGHQLPHDEEMRRLQRENEWLRQERDILKKRPCRYATPMMMKIGYTAQQREALRSRPRQWSKKPDKKAG